MASTYELIASQTLGSDTYGITFSSIPQTYDDLVLSASARDYASGVTFGYINLRPNGSTTSFSMRKLYANGASVYSATESAWGTFMIAYISGSTSTSNSYGSTNLYFPNYSGSTYKSVSATSVGETNGSTVYMDATAGLWSSTAALTSIELAGYFASGSSFYLYGVTHA